MNPATNTLSGLRYSSRGAATLLQHTVAQHRDAVAHGHRLHLVVGHIDGGGAESPLQCRDLVAGLHPQLGVEIRQRLVHQEHLRAAHDRASHRHPLALPTGEVFGFAVQIRLQVKQFRRVQDSVADFGLRGLGDLQREAHVLRDRHVRVERVVLEDHRDVAVLGIDGGDVAVADPDASGVQRFQPGHHPQRGRLAASGRTDQNDELAVADFQIEAVQGGAIRPRVASRRLLESH